mmetsp:Transcript_9217/g.19039  ORF Transcript_9217/g.19039 Transcript_9217/m.19039 type:complete len:249 (-) Transcript_9217:997-1743(-)
MSSEKKIPPNSPVRPSGHVKRTISGPLSLYEMHSFRPSPNLSDDVNYMDIVMIITRSSHLRQGSMGCLLVQPKNDTQRTGNHEDRIFNGIIAAANNSSLFNADDSDVHAEINAIGQIAKRNQRSATRSHATNCETMTAQGATAYITMPPCKKCFGALHASGITRIVSRRQPSRVLLETSVKVGIEMTCLTDDEIAEQKARLEKLFALSRPTSAASGENCSVYSANDVLKRRKQRKAERRSKKAKSPDD